LQSTLHQIFASIFIWSLDTTFGTVTLENRHVFSYVHCASASVRLAGGVNPCFVARYLLLTRTKGSLQSPSLFLYPVTYPTIIDLFWAMHNVSTLYAAHARARKSFDRGFAESDLGLDETSTGRQIRAGNQIEQFRCLYARIRQSGNALSSGCDSSDALNPCPVSGFVHAKDVQVLGNLYHYR